MKYLRHIVGITAALGMGLLFAVAPAYAADQAEEITVSPAILKLDAGPGQVSSGSFKVINTGQQEFRFTVYAKPYNVTTEQYDPNYELESPTSNVYKWVTFDITEGTLQPGDEQEVNYTMRVPADASPGSHRSVLFAETVPDESDNQMVVRKKRVGSVVRMVVDGERNEQARTQSIELPRVQWRSLLHADVRIENTGNVDVDATTEIIVRSIFGTELHTEQRTNAVFPDYPRTVEYTWGGAWRAGIYKVTVNSEVVGETTTVQRYVILAPGWLLAVLAVIIISSLMYAGYRYRR